MCYKMEEIHSGGSGLVVRGMSLAASIAVYLLHLMYKAECLFVCTLYKFTFLNRSQPNFAHISPMVWKRTLAMYGLTFFYFSTFSTFFVASGCRLQDRRWLPVQVIRDGVISVILTGLCATSRKRRRSRRQFRVLTATVLQLG